VNARAGAALKAQVAAGAARGHPILRELLAQAPVTSSPSSYRLRARLHWDPVPGILGFYAPQSWKVVSISGCSILSGALRASLPALRQALERFCPLPIDLEWLENLDGTEAVVALRPAKNGAQTIESGWLPPRGAFPPVVFGAWILSPRGMMEHGWGKSSVTMELPTPLTVTIGAFFQGNRHLVPWLFRRVRELADETPGEILDLHAGVGFLAAATAQHSREHHPTLVEPFRPAARAAAANLPGARVMAGWTAERYLERHEHLPTELLAIADPPRMGLSKRLRRQLIAWGPRRILMLSCDPATWSRDAAALLDAGYGLRHLELIDLFPSSHHVETLSILEQS